MLNPAGAADALSSTAFTASARAVTTDPFGFLSNVEDEEALESRTALSASARAPAAGEPPSVEASTGGSGSDSGVGVGRGDQPVPSIGSTGKKMLEDILSLRLAASDILTRDITKVSCSA